MKAYSLFCPFCKHPVINNGGICACKKLQSTTGRYLCAVAGENVVHLILEGRLVKEVSVSGVLRWDTDTSGLLSSVLNGSSTTYVGKDIEEVIENVFSVSDMVIGQLAFR
jgi:hypothetical protein